MESRKTETRRWHTKFSWTLAAGLALSLAACAGDPEPKETDPNGRTVYHLLAAPNCQTIEDRLVDALTEDALSHRYEIYADIAIDFDVADGEPAAPPQAGSDERAAGPDDYTTTNVQEAGVDEADFVKTDGNHIYLLRGNELVILKSWPADETEIIGNLSIAGNGHTNSMFLHEDRLAIFSQVYEYDSECIEGDESNEGGGAREAEPTAPPQDFDDDRWEPGCVYRTTHQFSGTRVALVDVSDRSNPIKLRHLDIEGYYTNARMIGSRVYLVSNSGIDRPQGYYDLIWGQHPNLPDVPGWDASEEDREDAINAARPAMRQLIKGLFQSDVLSILPVARNLDAQGEVINTEALYKCTDIYIPVTVTQTGLLNVTHFDINDITSFNSTGVLANGWEIYASQENLYVTMSSRSWWWGWGSGDNSSHIHKFALDGPNGEPRYAASGRVDGWILNQFSLSEHNGHLRVATTDNQWIWDEATRSGSQAGGNHLIVLKEDAGELVETGSVRNLAPGEQVFSARFMGDRGYVVTFEMVDPLFTFDLSDPNNPKLEGELKIDGFSSYMHPVGEDHLIGIGMDGDQFGMLTGFHLQLFDVTDMTDPTRIHHHVVSTGGWSSYSEAMHDHHAFTYHAASGILAVPVNIYDGNVQFSGLIVYQVDIQNGFTELGRVSHDDLVPSHDYWWTNIRRSIFMDDYLFSISQHGVKVNELIDPSVEYARVEF